jgi:hypothetical protein
MENMLQPDRADAAIMVAVSETSFGHMSDFPLGDEGSGKLTGCR